MDFQDKIISEGLTYDDVLLIPNYSEVLPREVAITSYAQYYAKCAYYFGCYGHCY